MTLAVCVQCAHENPAGSNFCSRCGMKLARASLEEAERKLVSILFADIVDSTAIVDGLDPEDALDQLRPAIKIMRAAIKRFGGTLCREQGDGVMAFFGAPKADDPKAVQRRSCVRCVWLPTLAPCIRFLSIDSHVCSTLPSDLASRR
jgi:class 3 adenylate cyclase